MAKPNNRSFHMEKPSERGQTAPVQVGLSYTDAAKTERTLA